MVPILPHKGGLTVVAEKAPCVGAATPTAKGI